MWNQIPVLRILTLRSHSSTDAALITLWNYFCILSKCDVWCYLPFIISFAIIMALRWQVYYLQIIMRTGENYFLFHFDITFVIAQIYSVSSGNIYSYAILRNILPMQQYFDFHYSDTYHSFKPPLFITFLDKASSLSDTN